MENSWIFVITRKEWVHASKEFAAKTEFLSFNMTWFWKASIFLLLVFRNYFPLMFKVEVDAMVGNTFITYI